MPRDRRKKKVKGDASDLSEVQTDATMGPPPSVSRVRHTESEMSSSDAEEERKRFKPGTPLAARAAAATPATDAVATDAAPAAVAAVDAPVVDAHSDGGVRKRESRLKKRAPVGVESGVFRELKAVTTSLREEVMVDGVPMALAKSVLEHSSRYEALLMRLVAENERLRGRLDVYEAAGGGAGSAVVHQTTNMPPAVMVPRRVQAQTSAQPIATPKPVETWSVVVKGKKGATSKEVVEKVVTEVGPTLGVRVHELRPLRDGGAVIRTPSVAEREKIAANTKFGEVGLEVSVKDKLGPKVVVQRVEPEITQDVFMEELYTWNFKCMMTPDQFRKSVRLVTGAWNPKGGRVNVVLEGSSEAMQHLLDVGRCYIKWFSFLVRPHDAVPSCFRCLGFDHMVKECRMKQDVCRLCGQVGHVASRCVNEINCRNCAFRGQPSGHLMMSAACPIYSAIVARANARQ